MRFDSTKCVSVMKPKRSWETRMLRCRDGFHFSQRAYQGLKFEYARLKSMKIGLSCAHKLSFSAFSSSSWFASTCGPWMRMHVYVVVGERVLYVLIWVTLDRQGPLNAMRHVTWTTKGDVQKNIRFVQSQERDDEDLDMSECWMRNFKINQSQNLVLGWNAVYCGWISH